MLNSFINCTENQEDPSNGQESIVFHPWQDSEVFTDIKKTQFDSLIVYVSLQSKLFSLDKSNNYNKM